MAVVLSRCPHASLPVLCSSLCSQHSLGHVGLSSCLPKRICNKVKYDLLVTMADLIGLILSSPLIFAMKRAVVTCSRPDMGVVLLLKGGWCSVYKAAKLDRDKTN